MRLPCRAFVALGHAACDFRPLMGISVVSVLHRLCICSARWEPCTHAGHVGRNSPDMPQVHLVTLYPKPTVRPLMRRRGRWVQGRFSRVTVNKWAFHVLQCYTLVALAYAVALQVWRPLLLIPKRSEQRI